LPRFRREGREGRRALKLLQNERTAVINFFEIEILIENEVLSILPDYRAGLIIRGRAGVGKIVYRFLY
jgi:hypothetical protein